MVFDESAVLSTEERAKEQPCGPILSLRDANSVVNLKKICVSYGKKGCCNKIGSRYPGLDPVYLFLNIFYIFLS
jgi:hypothetical protein